MGNQTQVVETEKKKDFGLLLTDKLDSVQAALPKDFNRTRFVQNCLSLLNDNPSTYNKFSAPVLLSNVVRASYLGLDFYNKECYLVPFGEKLTFMVGYTGAMKLAKKYSARPVKNIYAKLIHEGDVFEEVIVNGEPSINFRPKFPNDGKIIGAFAVVLFTDGGMNYDAMTLEELENTRKHSKASSSMAWKDFTGEMYKKTVIRRLCKYIDLEFENPTQQSTFDDDAAIETDPQKINEIEVEAEANTVDFMEIDG